MEEPPAQPTAPTAPVAPVTPPAPIPVAPPKSKLWTVLMVVLVILILGVAVFIVYQLQKPKATPVPAPQAPVIPAPQTLVKKIAYSKDNTLYVINADGSGGKAIASSSAGVSSFISGAWKDKNTFSYIKCANVACMVITRNLNTDVETKDVDIAETRVSALSWDFAGTKLAYIYSTAAGQTKLGIKTGATLLTIKTFAPAGGRGGSLDDNVSTYFSADGKYLLVTNTATQPNDTDKNTIWVFDVAGKEVLALPADSGWPTAARWIDNVTFIYKKGDKIYTRQVGSTTSQALPDKAGYNPVYVGGKVYSWENGDLPKIGTFTGYYHPEVLDNTHLAALKAKKLPAAEAMIMSFTSAGLSVIDLATSKITDLDTGEINLVFVSP